MDTKTLLIIPCCKEKATDGDTLSAYHDPLAEFVSGQRYEELLAARFRLLNTIRTVAPSLNGTGQSGNALLRDGPDFGKTNASGQYREAISRYAGFLYSVPGFASGVRQALRDTGSPRVLILSALYGPLHPLTPIQDYDLRMEDKTARKTWMDALPGFLEEYVSKNGIRDVRLYLGRTTAYLKVASRALQAIIQQGTVTATFYDVEGGTSRETPRNHGVRFLSDLGQPSSQAASKTIVEKPL